MTYSFDGYGSYTLTTKEGSKDETETGSYTIDGGYVTLNAKASSIYTLTNPEYVFSYYDSVEDEYYLAFEDDDTPLPYPNEDYQGPFSKVGNSYSMTEEDTVAGITGILNEVFETGTGTVSFRQALTYKNGGTDLFKFEMAGSATSQLTGDANPDAFMYIYNDTYTKYQTKCKYSVSGSSLKMYQGPVEVTFTKK